MQHKHGQASPPKPCHLIATAAMAALQQVEVASTADPMCPSSAACHSGKVGDKKSGKVGDKGCSSTGGHLGEGRLISDGIFHP